MALNRISARLAFVLAASLALIAGCDDSATPNVEEEEEGEPTSSSGNLPPGSGGSSGTTQDQSPNEPSNGTPDGGGQTPVNPAGDQGQGDGKDVVTIGDSYMRIGDGFVGLGPDGVEISLEKVAKRTYRKYGGTGVQLFPVQKATSILNGVIPDQFKKAKAEGANIKTVIAAGGGNDIGDQTYCHGAKTEGELKPECKKRIEDVDAAIQKMLGEMAKAGVKDVVWIGYGTMKTQKAELSGGLEYLATLRKAKCGPSDAELGLRCHYIDNKAALVGKIRSDGAHPTVEGYDIIAKAAWAVMQSKGIRR